jgi:hypothetical protein
MLRKVERVIEIGRRRQTRWEPFPSVHGTEPQSVVPCTSYAVPRAGNRHTGPLWQGAVATPVFGWLRPPNPLCTPIVASRVATARLPIDR